MGRVQSDGRAGRTDGQPRPDGGGGDGAGGSQRGCGGAGVGRHQRLLVAEQRLTQGGEAFLWSNKTRWHQGWTGSTQICLKYRYYSVEILRKYMTFALAGE